MNEHNYSLQYVDELLYKDFGIKHQHTPFDNNFNTLIGKLPRGAMVELCGQKSIGKSTLIYSLLGKLQGEGMVVSLIDADHTFDPLYAQTLGMNIDNLLVHKPTSLDETFRVLKTIVASRVIDFFVLDGLYNYSSDTFAKELEIHLEELLPLLLRTRTTLLIINQLYINIHRQYQTAGGNSLRYLSVLRLKATLDKPLKNAYGHFGNRVIIEAVKNNTDNVFTKKECKILFGEEVTCT